MMKDSPEGQIQYCQSCNELAAQVEVMREALGEAVKDMLHDAKRTQNEYGLPDITVRAAEQKELRANSYMTLALPNTAADILRQRDARVLREAAKRFITIESSIAGVSIKAVPINRLRHMAYELENANDSQKSGSKQKRVRAWGEQPN